MEFDFEGALQRLLVRCPEASSIAEVDGALAKQVRLAGCCLASGTQRVDARRLKGRLPFAQAAASV